MRVSVEAKVEVTLVMSEKQARWLREHLVSTPLDSRGENHRLFIDALGEAFYQLSDIETIYNQGDATH